MHVRTAFTRIAWRVAISAIAGLLLSVFAAVTLVIATEVSADRLTDGGTISGSLAQVFSAVVTAGLVVSIVVFACLVANDVLRTIGRWLFAQRGLFMALFRAIGWLVATIALAIVVALQYVARTTVVVEAVWLVRTFGKWVGLVLVCLMTFGGCAAAYVGMLLIGFSAIGKSTAIVVTTLDDPPRPLAMAFDLGGAAVLMYIGVGLFVLCLWLPYRLTRVGMRRVGARGLAPSRPEVALYRRWTSD